MFALCNRWTAHAHCAYLQGLAAPSQSKAKHSQQDQRACTGLGNWNGGEDHLAQNLTLLIDDRVSVDAEPVPS